MKFIQIKENKDSFYAVDDWLREYDYELEYHRALCVNPSLRNTIKCPDPLFRRLNWNQMNYENLSMMKMYVEFYDQNLEIVFLMTMADHVEKIHDPLNKINTDQKIEEIVK